MSTSQQVGPAQELTTEPDTPLAPWRRWLWPVFWALVVLGLIGIVMRIAGGHLPAGYGSYVPWGLWIAVYFHGVGIAAGAFGVTAVGFLTRIPGFRSLTSLRVAIILVAASVGPALLAVGLDLGRMERSWRILLTPNFTSMMAFNSWLYIALLVVCAVAWFLTFRPDNGWLRPVLILGLLIAVMVPSQSGAFFGVVDAKAYWHSALLPILLLVSAVIAGSATLLAVRGILADREQTSVEERTETLRALRLLRFVILIGIAVYLIMEFAEFSIAFWNPQDSSPAIELLLFGPYWWVFWIVHLLIGCVVPVLLLATRKPSYWVIAGAIVGVAFLSARLNVLIPGQSVGEIDGLQEAFSHPRLAYIYNATVMEYLVTFFCVAAAMAIFYIGLYLTERFAARPLERTSQK